MTENTNRIVIYGASWCPDARRSRAFLDENGITYTWVDIDKDAEAKAFVKETNNGQVVVPTIFFPDESILVEPSNSELAAKVGLFEEV
jgi:glutaredoxin-like protein